MLTGTPLFTITACCLLVRRHWTRVFVPLREIMSLVCMSILHFIIESRVRMDKGRSF